MGSDHQTRTIRKDLQELADLLDAHNYRLQAFTDYVASKSDTELWNFRTSNSLWGGAGSIADQAFLEHPNPEEH